MATHYDLARLFLAAGAQVKTVKGEGMAFKGRSANLKVPGRSSGVNGLVLGVDPGSLYSGYAIVNPQYGCREAGKVANITLLDRLALGDILPVAVAIEVMQSTGQVNGTSIYEACEMIGRVAEQCRMNSIPMYRYTRSQYVRALAGRVRKTSDAILREALLRRFGSDTKGEPMHALKGDSDRRSAFAVAVYHIDKMIQS